MSRSLWISACVAASIGAAALAHSGATGVVKERMDAMMSMGKAMKSLGPVMQGTAPYNADTVRAAADVMLRHSGSDMTRLFPEGSNAKPSETLDTVWEEWEAFSRIAMRLNVAAEGLKRAADNGLGTPGTAPADSGMMGAGAMMGTGTMGTGTMGTGTMGTGTMMGGAMMGGGMAEGTGVTADMLAGMPVNAAFMAVTATCSSCHKTFRAEEN